MLTLSVIIPVYNVAPYLRRCVGSVMHQTYRQLEIILVDDGSTDDSGAICDELAQEDERIHVIHKTNGGSSSARNMGLKIASGDFIVFLDSDDAWLRMDGIEIMMAHLMQHPADIMLFKRINIYPKHEYFMKKYDENYILSHSAQEVFSYLVYREQFSLSTCIQLIKRELLERNNIHFDERMLNGEDTHFSCLIWQKAAHINVVNIDMYGCYRRRGSVSTSYSIRHLQSYDKLFDFWTREIISQCINFQAIGALLANLYTSASYSYFFVSPKDRKEAIEILLKHQNLLNKASTKKSLRMKKMVDIVGIRLGIFIFATYGWLKKHYMTITDSLA